ncbi:MAG: sensor histidine kinase N-terminal domain-containing protein, partial [Rubrivivax sp.]|nr:sensor histidine kinase N-terminal domain-containing protein [Rubrivivax sp.]
MPASREQRSLFGEILDWMLAPLLLLWPMSVALTWVVAQGIANRPYDRELADLVRAMSQQMVEASAQAGNSPHEVRNQLRRTATMRLRRDDDDRIFFQVLGTRGEIVAGDAQIPVPPYDGDKDVQLRSEVIRGDPVRVAWMWLPIGPAEAEHRALVQLAETLDKRSQLATEIIKGVILPQFVILPLAVILVWFALSRGIQPLADLQLRIRRRESDDLSPISERDVPEEVAPLVGAINDLLLRLDRSLVSQRHFLADAAHQLKTPLAGLRMQAEVAEREIDSGQSQPEQMKHSLRQIALASQRAAHMVNQLLAMARAEGKGQPLEMLPVDLAAITRDVVQDFVPLALDRRIDLGYEGPDTDQPAWLRGHGVLLRELVRNLVDNALRYTPAGGTVTARVTPDPFGQVLVLQLEDNGP